nr:MAG TPA: hypothetical protein [Caudoviricetes sp.]
MSFAYCHLLPYIWNVDIGVRPAGTECLNYSICTTLIIYN